MNKVKTRFLLRHIWNWRKGEGCTTMDFLSWRNWFDKQNAVKQKQIREEYEESQMNIVNAACTVDTAGHVTTITNTQYPFGCMHATPSPTPLSKFKFPICKQAVCEAKQEKDSAMNCNQQDTRTEAQQAKDYLIYSLDQTIHIQQNKATETFNITRPKITTFGELKAALENGWFQVAGDRKDDSKLSMWSSPIEYLKIEDPKNPANTEGHEAALKQISKDASDVKDAIVVFGAEKGLEALNAFKAKEYK